MEPQKLFIGLTEFFSVILPGALLTYFLMAEVGPLVLGPRYSSIGENEGWAVFGFASYLFGHLVFLLGAWLDEEYTIPGSPQSDDAPSREVDEQLD